MVSLPSMLDIRYSILDIQSFCILYLVFLSYVAFFSLAIGDFGWYNGFMVATKQQALEIAVKARKDLERIYDKRLRGVYLYGSAARDQLTPDSDIDIAIILDEIQSRFEEHELTGDLYSQISLDNNTVVTLSLIHI